MKRVKIARWLLVGIAFLSVSLGSLAVYSFVFQRSAFLTTSSPQGTYTISFMGQRGRPLVPLVNHSVSFKVLKGGKPLVSDRDLHSGDWLDPSFDILFPQHAWSNDKTLHLYRDQNRRETPHDSVLVTNTSNSEIEYLIVRSIDTVILLDVTPGSTSQFSVSRARADFKPVFVEGEFRGGRKISYGESFDIPKRPEFSTYQIKISENGISIENPR